MSPQAERTPLLPKANGEHGKLVVCIASKCEYDNGQPADVEGPTGLAALAHKYGFPVTYYMKPFTVEACRSLLKEWHARYGDEVGYFGDGAGLQGKRAELKRLRRLVDWQPITSAGDLHYGLNVSEFYLGEGIQSVWGRCYEQSYTDGITDRGCPPGFYYALPACFRAPNPTDGGLITVPWLSNDPNLVYWTAQQSTFTFDPNDPQDVRVANARDDSFWRAELEQYQKQTQYDKFVPLVVQQETGEFNFKDGDLGHKQEGAAILENLFKVLKERHITVVNVSEAVRLYKEAYPESTPPTYELFDNLGSLPIIRASTRFKMMTERFIGTNKMAKINGYYACKRGEKDGSFEYFSADGKAFYEHKRNLTYYDKNGLLIFDENNPAPIRITSYLSDPVKHMNGILPELSTFFDTDKYIPKADVHTVEEGGRLRVKVKVDLPKPPDFTEMGDRLPYGVMLWGDYSGWTLPDNAPAGAKILARDGLIVPFVLKKGPNEMHLELSR